MADLRDPYRGADANNTTKSSAFGVQGVDVSRYQGDYDWDLAMGAGEACFGFARASIGFGDTDSKFMANWKAMADRGLLRGAYHFAYPKSVAAGKSVEDDAHDEARYYCDTLRAAEQSVHGGKPMYDGRTLPPVLDYEQKSPWTAAQKRAWITRWILTVQEELQRGVILYTGEHVWTEELEGDPWLTGLPLWVAHYTDTAAPKMAPWTRWVLWQWSGGGEAGDIYEKVHGAYFPGDEKAGAVDVDAFWGSHEALTSLADPRWDRWLVDADGTIGKNPHAAFSVTGEPVGEPASVGEALAKLRQARALIDEAIASLEG
ncbi:glycoside hydrolase family 25 protein [Pseudenhygromyxa sp. WMMC2535]|uniref:glycoside hydrolase family 25 protein n=1 Tax=Pseudenhygromyxa sp. WMMC2535 TaxID=2712867 RepID=UPI001553DA8D|nr:glycoside hydrolase family 25 protein [Pseudenhygromyxa sp. WMMC2535]NVB42309.1 glycoside hydrolase family 25 protein [Pseudenhygromyxa sp. WMMC2535]